MKTRLMGSVSRRAGIWIGICSREVRTDRAGDQFLRPQAFFRERELFVGVLGFLDEAGMFGPAASRDPRACTGQTAENPRAPRLSGSVISSAAW